MAPLNEYLAGLDMSALPDSLIEDITREAAADAAPNAAEIERLTEAFTEADGRANTTAAELAALQSKLEKVQAHNYELITNGGVIEDDNSKETVIDGEGDVLIEGDPVLDKFFTEIDN